MQVEVISRNHSIIIDEPLDLGRTDTGMNPIELLLGALGTCKCIVAHAFAPFIE